MFETYKGKIVQVFGGLNNFIGEIETFEPTVSPLPIRLNCQHPNGTGWIRINNPVQVREYHNGKKIEMFLERMGGISYNFKSYVDMYIPPGQSIMEIRELEPDSELGQLYYREWGREKPSLISSPTNAELMRVAEKKH